MLNFIRLQLKLKWGFNRNNSKKNAIMTTIAALFAAGIALALVWLLTYVLQQSVEVTTKQLSVFFLTILIVGLTVAAIGMQINRLYRPGDMNLTARFPLSSFKLFVSYIILNYIDLCIYSTVLLLPIMIVFGFSSGCITGMYFVGLLIGLVLFPLIPFGLSIFIAIPIMFINSLLKRHNIIRLILFIVFLAGCFALYYYILTVLSQFFIHRNWEVGTLEIWRALLGGLDKFYNPAYYIGNVIFFEKFWIGIGGIIGASALLMVGGIFVAKLVYEKIRIKELDGSAEVLRHSSKLDEYGSGRAILRYTFNEIIHTKSYSYFYLGVAISTPVMVFLCNKLVKTIGEAEIGNGINFGAAILVVSVFMAMISAFSAQIISIEGKNFYITKIVPVPYRKQLFIKAIINIFVSIGALIISTIVMAALKFINATEIGILLACELLFILGLVFNSVNLNLANPNLKPKANGEPEEINITFMLIIGLTIAAILGMISLLLPKTVEHGNLAAYITIICAALAYAIINVVIFCCTADKKYRNIEM